MPSRFKRWIFRFVMLVMGVGVTFTAFMFVTERFIARQAPQTLTYASHPFRRFVLTPGQTYRTTQVDLEINRFGMRGLAPETPKPKNQYRIFSMGGSSVFDHRVSVSWPEKLEKNLRQLGFQTVDSYCAGVPGYSSRETLAFYHDVIGNLEPDLVLLYQGWNDVKYMVPFRQGLNIDIFYKQRDFERRYRFIYGPRPVRNWHALLLMLRMWGGEAGHLAEGGGGDTGRQLARTAAIPAGGPVRGWTDTPGMRFWRRNIDTWVRSVLQDGAIPVLVVQNTLATAELPHRWREKISYHFVQMEHEELVRVNELMAQALAETAARYSIPFIDLRAEISGRPGYFMDHVHLTPTGSDTFARLLARRLVPWIEEAGVQPTGDETAQGRSAVVSHWNFDAPTEAGRNSGSLAENGSARGNAIWRSDCRGGGCLEFDGERSEMRVPSAPLLHLVEDFSISVWVNPAHGSPPKSQGLVVKSGEYHLTLRQGRPAFFGYGLEPAGWHVADSVLLPDRWQRVTVRLKDGVLQIQVDGQTVYRTTVAGSVEPSSRPLLLGSGNGHFHGRLDDVELSQLW